VLDDTLILVMSDNGGNAESGPQGVAEGGPIGGPDSRVFLGMGWATLANTPFRRYKHFTHEGGIATPMIAHWPRGIAAERAAVRDLLTTQWEEWAAASFVDPWLGPPRNEWGEEPNDRIKPRPE
jgi:arylsulfatase A-like enzyme